MISTKLMRELEDRSVKAGVSRFQLMENAGRGAFSALSSKEELKNKKIAVVCYHGNNGGDGFVLARYLCDESDVTVVFVGDESKLKDEARLNLTKLEKIPHVQILYDIEDIDFDEFHIIIDALLGTGTKGPVNDPIRSIIRLMNESGAKKVSLDVPSGIDPDTGNKNEHYVRPDLLIAFHDLKEGLAEFSGSSQIIDIGIPDEIR